MCQHAQMVSWSVRMRWTSAAGFPLGQDATACSTLEVCAQMAISTRSAYSTCESMQCAGGLPALYGRAASCSPSFWVLQRCGAPAHGWPDICILLAAMK